jgi:hypothetical protein
VHADHVVGVHPAQVGGDPGADVAALGAVAVVAEPGHQLGEGAGDPITRWKASAGSPLCARGSASGLAGTFTPSEELFRDAATAHELNLRLLERAKATGAGRADLDVNDLSFVFEQVASVRLGGQDRTSQLRHRYLALLLDGLHTPAPGPLPGPPPTWEEIGGRWDRPASP